MPVNVLTQRNAPDRQGINRQETNLHPDNVRFDRFGKLGFYPVNASVYAQPLFVSGVDCGANGLKDLVIVATMENSVYAFDATQTGANAQVWPAELPGGLKLGDSVPSGKFKDYGDFSRLPIGILSTPVIELTATNPASGTIYLVSFQFDQAAFAANQDTATPAMFRHILYALDLGTGKVLRQTTISGQFPGAGYLKTKIPSDPPGDDMVLRHKVEINAAQQTVSMTIEFNGKDVPLIDVTGLGSPIKTASSRPAYFAPRQTAVGAGFGRQVKD
jgi:hypothetical protein